MQDEECNKMMLYNARTLRNLKKCLEVYDRVKEKTQRRKITKKDSDKDSAKETKNA